ncbi:MAG: DUF1918 domain-containing protein [Gaiellaceae bacterium]
MTAKPEFKARVGDHLHLHSRKRLGAAREGEIVEVRGTPEKEYYLVRWANDRESLIHPGLGVTIPEVDTRARAAASARPTEQPEPTTTPETKPAPKPRPFELHKAIESSLRAEPGDRLVIKSRRLDGAAERDAEILEILGDDGHPPYRVRWSDNGRETITRPGSDAFVDHLNHKKS